MKLLAADGKAWKNRIKQTLFLLDIMDMILKMHRNVGRKNWEKKKIKDDDGEDKTFWNGEKKNCRR